ncbi:MAG: hypothetical protein QXP51_05400, partial [Candidatus Hadarchaeales archaeon]
LYAIYLAKQKNKIYNYCVSMNNTFLPLYWEVAGRAMLGILDLKVYELEETLICDPNLLDDKACIEAIEKIKRRPIRSIFEELGFDPEKPIREQEPAPLPDRKALDDLVFDALGLTEQERKEVYWAVAELVKSRLDKARSV